MEKAEIRIRHKIMSSELFVHVKIEQIFVNKLRFRIITLCQFFCWLYKTSCYKMHHILWESVMCSSKTDTIFGINISKWVRNKYWISFSSVFELLCLSAAQAGWRGDRREWRLWPRGSGIHWRDTFQCCASVRPHPLRWHHRWVTQLSWTQMFMCTLCDMMNVWTLGMLLEMDSGMLKQILSDRSMLEVAVQRAKSTLVL